MAQFDDRTFATAALVCAVCGICGWAFYVAVFWTEPGRDWMVFYTAAHAYLDGDLALLQDGARFTAALNDRFHDWLAFPLSLHPWVYPPHFLLLFLPFGLLPAGWSFAAFLSLTYAAALVACGALLAPRLRPFHAFTLLLCPAVGFAAFTGQNAFLTSALFVAAFGVLERRPVLAGALAGILTFKPQVFLVVPVALLAARSWRALAGMAASASLAAVASLLLFGWKPWRDWLALATGSGTLYAEWLAAGRLQGVSVFACATLLGAPPAVAHLAQAAAAAFAMVCVYAVFRRPVRAELRMAALLAAAMLAAPHASASDALLLGLAAGFYVAVAAEGGLAPADAVWAAALWISPLFNPPSLIRIGLVTPLVIVGFLARVVAAGRAPQAAQSNDTRTGTRIGQADRSIV